MHSCYRTFLVISHSETSPSLTKITLIVHRSPFGVRILDTIGKVYRHKWRTFISTRISQDKHHHQKTGKKGRWWNRIRRYSWCQPIPDATRPCYLPTRTL